MALVSLAFGYAPPPQTTNHAAPPQTINPLVLLDTPGAQCLDGSFGGYHYAPATTRNDTWLFYLEGGGECASESSCKYQRDTKLGSSTKWMNPRHLSNPMYQLASGDAVENPALYGAHRVYLPYCTQDLWSGSSPTAGEWGLHFGGRLIIDAIIDALLPQGLADAATVVLTGASAGGIGVWINVDHLQSRLPHARVIGAPIAGFYAFAYPYTGAHHTSSTLADFREAAWPDHVSLWKSALPTACVAARGGGDAAAACMLSNYSAPTVAAPMFVVEAQTDSVQLGAHDWVPKDHLNDTEVQAYLSEWKANQTVGLQATLKPIDGWFNPACFIHTGFHHAAPRLHDPTTGKGYAYGDAFAEWLAATLAGGGAAPLRLMDDCGLMCNPDCGVA